MRSGLVVLSVVTGLLSALLTHEAKAACEEALVMAQLTAKSSHDKRLAILVTQSRWQQAHDTAGLNATLFDVPIGASYDSYHSAASAYLSQTNLSEQDSYEVAWSGLDPNSVSAYEACLKAQAAQLGGAHLAIVAADGKRYTLLVSWNEPGSSKTDVSWAPKGVFKNLPDSVLAGSHKLTVDRPVGDTLLSWNARFSASETVRLRALPGLAQPGCVQPAYAQGLFVGEQTLDFNNDGCPDVANVFGPHMGAIVEVNFGYRKGSLPPPSVRGSIGDQGYPAYRWWVDLDGDGPRYFCRIAGDGPYIMLCTKVTASGADGTRNLGQTDRGWIGTGYWRVTSGNIRYCRGVGNDQNNPRMACARTDGNSWLSSYDPP